MLLQLFARQGDRSPEGWSDVPTGSAGIESQGPDCPFCGHQGQSSAEHMFWPISYQWFGEGGILYLK